MLGAGRGVDVFAHEVQQVPPQITVAVNVLQSPQDGNDFVATIQIQFDFCDGRAIVWQDFEHRGEQRDRGPSSVGTGEPGRDNG